MAKEEVTGRTVCIPAREAFIVHQSHIRHDYSCAKMLYCWRHSAVTHRGHAGTEG